MKLRFQVWWLTIRQHPMRNSIIAFAFALLVAFVLSAYLFDWNWAGFNGGFSQITSTTTSHGTTITTVQPPTNRFGIGCNLPLFLLLLPLAGFGSIICKKVERKKTTEQRAKIEKKKAKKRARAEREIASDNQREAALQAYIDRISELLLHERLSEADDFEAEASGSAQSADIEDYINAHKGVRKIARVRTLTILSRLDGTRKRSVLQFLKESGLIHRDKRIVDLSGADLSNAELGRINMNPVDWNYADLRRTNLRGASLWMADLSHADLSHANLQGADLNGADLRGAVMINTDLTKADLSGSCLQKADLSLAYLGDTDLYNTDLSGSNLRGVQEITIEELKKARSLKGATMPDGSIHP